MSRPWKTYDARRNVYSLFVMCRTSLIPNASAAGTKSPLSGPTKIAPSHAMAIARRAVPTPGSTTPTWIANGNQEAAEYKTYAPSRTSWAPM